jgi:hypothetical protein
MNRCEIEGIHSKGTLIVRLLLASPVKPLPENVTAQPGHYGVGKDTHEENARQDIEEVKIHVFKGNIQ